MERCAHSDEFNMAQTVVVVVVGGRRGEAAGGHMTLSRLASATVCACVRARACRCISSQSTEAHGRFLCVLAIKGKREEV